MRIVIFDNDDYESLLEHNEHTHEETKDACHTYIDKYGMHFNKKLMEFAVGNMKTEVSSTGELVNLIPITKAELDSMLVSNGITINNNKLYDYLYVANMCKADFMNSSIIDERHLCLYVKDVIDDPDGYDGLPFARWKADVKHTGLEVNWEDML